MDSTQFNSLANSGSGVSNSNQGSNPYNTSNSSSNSNNNASSGANGSQNYNQSGLSQQYHPMMQNSFYPQQQQQQVPQFHQFQQQSGYPPNISHQSGSGGNQNQSLNQPIQQQSGSNDASAQAAAAAAAAAAVGAAGDFNYSQMANPNNQQMNQQQLSELMYNSFLTHLAQKQMPNSTGSSNPNQKQFGNNANAAAAAAAAAAGLQNNMMLDPMHQQQLLQQQQMLQQQQLQQQAMQQQAMQQQMPSGKKQSKSKNIASPAASSVKGQKNKDVKKLSSTQTRIEKRKQLKKQGPKRPSSAYFLFSMSIRNELLQEHPHAKVPELSKLASIRWKDLTDEQKKPFYDEFRTNWEKYRVLRDEYEKTLPPKRPSGPFIQFTQDIRPLVVKENPERNLIEITKIIGEKWRQLDPAKKAEYTENYRIRLKEWESCYPEEAEEDNLKIKVKKPRKKKVKNADVNIDPNAANPNDLNPMNVMNPMSTMANMNGMPPNAAVNQN